jgi:hypothetical protein
LLKTVLIKKLNKKLIETVNVVTNKKEVHNKDLSKVEKAKTKIK